MISINFSILYSLTFFFFSFYIIFIYSIFYYILPITYSNTSSKIKNQFYIINSWDLSNFLMLFLASLIIPMILLSGPSASLWYNHLIFSNIQIRIYYLIILSFAIVSQLIYSNIYLSGKEVYDYLITTIFFMIWLVLLFFSNSIFTTVFNIEVLSTLIFTLHITSVFSNSISYNTNDLSSFYLFQNSNPSSYLKSLIFFYWISLISSINLFLLLIVLYINFYTFDWYILEIVFMYLSNNVPIKDVIISGTSWLILIICVFTKCGIAPLFIWKPTFFKGLSFQNIFFYIVFFYLYLFFYFIYLIDTLFSVLLIYYSHIIMLFSVVGFILLITIIFEASYIKSFLAVSSILNSLLVLLTLVANDSFFINLHSSI